MLSIVKVTTVAGSSAFSADLNIVGRSEPPPGRPCCKPPTFWLDLASDHSSPRLNVAFAERASDACWAAVPFRSNRREAATEDSSGRFIERSGADAIGQLRSPIVCDRAGAVEQVWAGRPVDR